MELTTDVLVIVIKREGGRLVSRAWPPMHPGQQWRTCALPGSFGQAPQLQRPRKGDYLLDERDSTCKFASV
jgi:hypothetical protein